MAKLEVIKSPVGALQVKENELRAGNVRLVRTSVHLEAGKDYTGIQGKLLLSPDGADKLNAVAGLSIFMPRDEKSWETKRDAGGFVEVTRRCLVVGRTPLGAMQAVDATVNFSPRAYFMHALAKKLKYNRDLGFIGDDTMRPEAKEGERWKYFPVDEESGLWVNMAHKEFVGVFEAYIQDRKFADRRCASIARRNALSQHGAMPSKMLGKYDPQRDGKYGPASVSADVFFWKGDDDRSDQEMIDLAQSVATEGVKALDVPPESIITVEASATPEEDPMPIEEAIDAPEEADGIAPELGDEDFPDFGG